MNILFLQPYGETIRGLTSAPYAVMYIAAVAEQMGHKVKILDRHMETNARKIINSFAPDMLCVTSLTGGMITDALKVCRFVKNINPGIPIVWGGIHASLLPEETLKNGLVDFVVIGEGELTFKEFLNAYENNLDYAQVLGLGYKKNGRIFINPRRPFLKPLDSVPLIPWHLIDPRKYLKYETLFLTSRGCPHRCAFCYNEKYYFRTWRAMSPQRVKQEIDHAKKFHPIRRYRFDDDNFTVDKQRFYKILEFIPKDSSIYFETRADYIDEEFCKEVSKFRDVYLFIGTESGDEEILKNHQKDITVPAIRSAFKLLNDYHIKTSASFIIGAPGETKAQIENTVELARQIRPTRYSICLFTLFPGTAFYDQISKNQKDIHLPKSLEEWGKFTTVESMPINYSRTDTGYLKKIYNRYVWQKTILSFILSLRLRWLLIGIENASLIYTRRIQRLINKDI